MPFIAYYRDPEGKLQRDLTEPEIKSALASQKGVLWVDIFDTTPQDGEFLLKTFGFHHLAIGDCVSPNVHSPKIDDFGEYVFIVVHGINYAVESHLVEIGELNLFLGPNYVVSNHNAPLFSIDVIKALVADDGRPMRKGAVFLLHALIDALVDHVLPAIDRMSEMADDVEEEVIRNPQEQTLEGILRLKRSAMRVHRVMAPQREVLNRMSRGDFAVIAPEAEIFFRDIYDHTVRLEELSQTIRDRATDGLSMYLSAVANRQNETMKALSLVAVIFLPLSLVAGIYGMNFENMPELGISWGYYAVLGLMGAVGLILLWLFWARRWLMLRRQRLAGIRPFMVDPRHLAGYAGHLDPVKRWHHVTRIGRHTKNACSTGMAWLDADRTGKDSSEPDSSSQSDEC